MIAKKKPAPKLKLRVGGVYVDGDGNECHILSASPYTDHFGMQYRESGRCESDWRKHDLIREVRPRKPKAAKPKPVLAWVVINSSGNPVPLTVDITRANVVAAWGRHLGKRERIARVEIREAPKVRR